jgi:hypothetical protein
LPFPPNPVNYTQAGPGNAGGLTTDYSVVNTNTSEVAQGASYSFSQAFGYQQEFTGTAFRTAYSIDLQKSQTLTWTHSWENTLTTTTTLTNALSVTGPGCSTSTPPCVPAYTGPGEFIVFQDNLFGTFMFYPSN